MVVPVVVIGRQGKEAGFAGEINNSALEVLQSMWSPTVQHDRATELNWIGNQEGGDVSGIGLGE